MIVINLRSHDLYLCRRRTETRIGADIEAEKEIENEIQIEMYLEKEIKKEIEKEIGTAKMQLTAWNATCHGI